MRKFIHYGLCLALIAMPIAPAFAETNNGLAGHPGIGSTGSSGTTVTGTPANGSYGTGALPNMYSINGPVANPPNISNGAASAPSAPNTNTTGDASGAGAATH